MWEQVKTRADLHIELILADQDKKVKFFYSSNWGGKGCMQEEKDLVAEISLPGIVF